jgi:glycerol-3-phosphate dehydrogenase
LPGENQPILLPNRSSETGRIEGQGIHPSAEGFPYYTLPAYDLIVIGGGINGTGIARDAALRGLKVLLLEKNDFGSGTSAYSSRLIHGGLRYLANLELDLVYESLSERELLLKNASHLVRPLALGIPVYQGGQHSALTVGAGMMLYDLLSLKKSLPWHQAYGHDGFLKRYPQVNPVDLQGGPVYYDAQVDFPELICVENAISAKETGNASLLNHAQVTGVLSKKGAMGGVYFQDLLNGQSYVASAQVVVNAAGPWLDDIIQLAASESKKNGNPLFPRIGGTKGSHIVVRRFENGPDTALYVEARSDGRPFFIIPWRDEFYLIGTTDIPFEGNLDQVAATGEEVEYLLSETNQVLPQANLSLDDVLYSYSGVRPLPAATGVRAGKISRKHWIEDHRKSKQNPMAGLISVIGGKLTTYRNLSKATVDYVLKAYQLKAPKPQCQTRHMPLPGAVGLAKLADYKAAQVAKASQQYQVSPKVVFHLIDLYGSRYERVLQLTEACPDWKAPLAEGRPDILAQVVYAVREQMAQTVMDVMLRRIGCGLDADCGFDVLETVARCMGQLLDWPEDKINEEMRAYRAFIEQRHLIFRHSENLVLENTLK